MASERLVECQDCGNRWESTADSPRCSKSDCGRSRNVEPVADDLDDEDDEQDEDEAHGEAHTEAPVEDEQDTEQDTEQDSGGYTPAFEAAQVRKDAERQTPTSTSDEDTDESTDEQDAEDSTDDSTDEQPEGEGEIPDIDPEQLKPALDATFSMVAVNRGDHWRLDDEEAEKLAEGWCPVINHYAPHFLKEHTTVGAAAIITFSVLGPRLAEDRRLAEQAEREAEAEETEQAGTVREARTEEDTDTVDAAVDEQQPDAAEAPGGYASV